MAPKPAPPLNAPASETTVTVSAIDSTLRMGANIADAVWTPKIKGFTHKEFMTWSFLIEHPSGRRIVYDLGLRKDWENLAPAQGVKEMKESGMMSKIDVEEDTADLLKAGGIDLNSIEGVIWSHWHFDHTGNPATFPSSTKLIVGPGFKKVFTPGYPADPQGRCLESDFKRREVQEIDFSNSNIKIGRFTAFDYFGDGSFYILDSPGHTIGHINALARTNATPSPAFIHLGGDSLHHLAEIRPNEYLPLPDTISPSPFPDLHAQSCPGHIFDSILRNGSKTEHLIDWVDPEAGHEGYDPRFGLVYDVEANKDTVKKDEELDAHKDIFFIIAHEGSLKGVIDEFPKTLNDWKAKGWKENTTWKFLEDFKSAVA